jgi:hypothetical protein
MEGRARRKAVKLVDGEDIWRGTGGGALRDLPVLFKPGAKGAGWVLDGVQVRGQRGRGAVGEGVGGVWELRGEERITTALYRAPKR